VDNTLNIEEDNAAEESKRAISFVQKCTTLEDLDHLEESLPDIAVEVAEAIEAKRKELTNNK
jgi:hypothetical protein